MNLLAIVASPRKGKATDTLVDKAIEGAREANPGCAVKKLYLSDHNIQFCRNCLVCRDRKTEEPVSECAIHDGMDEIAKDILAADALIFGTPVHMGYAPAIMTVFLERVCWTFGKPEGRELTVKGCPVPRSEKQRKAVIIITSGIVPPLLRRFCDAATAFIKGTINDSLNAETVGDMYAGDLEHRGVERYFSKAKKLGYKLTGQIDDIAADAPSSHYEGASS